MVHIQKNGTKVVFSENLTFKDHIDFRGTVTLSVLMAQVLGCRLGLTWGESDVKLCLSVTMKWYFKSPLYCNF